MTADPYLELGVEQGASDAEIKIAYERAITKAARDGLLETAKRIDAAYEVLRNPSRRALFDRAGVVHEMPRLDPAGSYFAPAAAPWRSWSPEEQVAATVARTKTRPSRFVMLGVVALLVAILGVNLHAMRHGGATTLTADESGTTLHAFGGAPPIAVTAHPKRLLAPVAGPAGSGGYTYQGSARWNPCQPIHYVVSGAEPFTGANQLLTQALGEASAASGLKFTYDGPTTEAAGTNRPSYQPQRYGRTWAPVLVAWTDQSQAPELAGNVIGLGGAASASVRGHDRLVSGILFFDAPELSLIAQRPTGFASMRTVMLHEIGHLLGLGHVQDTTAVMYPSDDGQGDYNAGDLRGLAYAGNGECSKYS